MKVMLIQPFKDTGFAANDSYPPVGLGFLANYVRNRGFHVSILDCIKSCRDMEDFICAVENEKPDVVGFTLFTIAVPYVQKMTEALRRRFQNMVIVLGGPHVSSLPERVMNQFPAVNFAVRGEGEIPFLNLLENLRDGKHDLKSIPGLIFRLNGANKINNPIFLVNIEEYGYPAWDLIRPQDYFGYMNVGPYSVPVFFSRGCPYPCTFCAAKVTSGQRLRKRTLDHIFEELHLLISEYRIKRFIIEDEGFGTSKNFIMEFCNRVLSEKLNATFSMGVGMRLDIIDEELLRKMKASRFDGLIALGIESGSDRILALMKKKTSKELIYKKVQLMDRCGFQPTAYMIIGYPGETREEMEMTIQMALELPFREASFTPFQPLPATEATNMLLESGELPKDYDFLAEKQNSITYAPKGMTLEEIGKIRKNAVLRFYLRPKVILHHLTSYRKVRYTLNKVYIIFFQNIMSRIINFFSERKR